MHLLPAFALSSNISKPVSVWGRLGVVSKIRQREVKVESSPMGLFVATLDYFRVYNSRVMPTPSVWIAKIRIMQSQMGYPHLRNVLMV